MSIRSIFDPLFRYFSSTETSSPATPKSSASTPTSATQKDPLLDSLPRLTSDFALSQNSVEVIRPQAYPLRQELNLEEKKIENTFRSILIRANGMKSGLRLSMKGHYTENFLIESTKEPSLQKNVEFLLHRSTVIKSSQNYAIPALKKGKRGWKSYIYSTPREQKKESDDIVSGTMELFIEASKAKIAPKIRRILKTEGTAEDKYRDCYITKYANRGDLVSYLGANQDRCSDLWLELGEKLIQKVALLHSLGIAHRDIKPDNVLVDENDEIEVYLCDFGYATKNSSSSQKPGSRGYFPPEYKQIYFGGQEILHIPEDPISEISAYSPFLVDRYTLGLTLYALLNKDSFEENLIVHLEMHREQLETLYQGCTSLQEFIALKQKICDLVIEENLADWPKNIVEVLKGLIRHNPSERISLDHALKLWTEASGTTGCQPIVDPDEIKLDID